MRGVVALALVLVALGFGPAWPEPQTEPLLPLAVGATWTWHTNYGTVTEKVARRVSITLPGSAAPCDCLVVETTVEETADKVVQFEYYTVADHDIRVVKRSYPGDETVLNPPELVMRTPLVVGDHWDWDGDTGTGHAHLEFRVLHAEKLNIPALKRVAICQKIVMQGTSANGSTISVTRWYVAGVGMVKEDSVMTKGQQSIIVKGVLTAFRPAP